jgi:hypothetical protein
MHRTLGTAVGIGIMIGARDIIGAQNAIDADGDEQRRT